jgi:8-amino-7-oxononanoate synthase
VRGFSDLLTAELEALSAANRRRSCPELAGASRARPSLGFAVGPGVAEGGGPGAGLLSFASNDYLGLAAHPALAAAAAEAAARDGFGASASRLVTGDLPAHRALEAGLAAFVRRPAALLFPSGYQTNLGVLGALAGPDDLIVSDELNHASIIDGCRLARARVAVYSHRDAAAAQRHLAEGSGARRRLLVTESLFSMDGDVAPLAELAQAAVEADAILVVDEAHALGVLGPGGRGLAAAAGVVPDVLVGTLGKAFGASGGFAAGIAPLRELLVNRARTFIFTTALPPPVAAAAAAALAIIESPEGDRRRAVLDEHRRALGAALVARDLRTEVAPGPIAAVVLGTEARALAAAATLRARGLWVPAIRPPTVPPGTARLRITLSSDHRAEEIVALADALAEVTA